MLEDSAHVPGSDVAIFHVQSIRATLLAAFLRGDPRHRQRNGTGPKTFLFCVTFVRLPYVAYDKPEQSSFLDSPYRHDIPTCAKSNMLRALAVSLCLYRSTALICLDKENGKLAIEQITS